jgi:hypothetical protein
MSELAGGGRSPVRTFLQPKFPANREKYRESCVVGQSHPVITPHLKVF